MGNTHFLDWLRLYPEHNITRIKLSLIEPNPNLKPTLRQNLATELEKHFELTLSILLPKSC